RDHAAELFHTNPRYVSDAKRIKAEAPELAEQVALGMKLCKRFTRVLDALAKGAPNAGRGGSGSNQHQKKENVRADVLQFSRASPNRPAVLSAKLAEHHPEHWQAYLAGTHRTVYAAAVTTTSKTSRRLFCRKPRIQGIRQNCCDNDLGD